MKRFRRVLSLLACFLLLSVLPAAGRGEGAGAPAALLGLSPGAAVEWQT